jgi:hypothetical protein
VERNNLGILSASVCYFSALALYAVPYFAQLSTVENIFFFSKGEIFISGRLSLVL